MSIMNAMWTGVSGLAAEGSALGVVGDNVANSNTIGFKQSRAQFEDVLGGAVGSNIGAGVKMVRAQQIFAQGSLMSTGQPTDLALSGDGFFVVNGAVDGMPGDYFTRAGQSTVNQDGFLVNPDGMKFQGYTADANGNIGAQMGDIQIPTTPLTPKATTEFDLTANLSSAATPIDPAVNPFDPTKSDSYTTSTSTTMYDSLGNAHAVNIYFVKSLTGGFDYHVQADGKDITGGTQGTPVPITNGHIDFDPSGKVAPPVTGMSASVNFSGGGTQNQPINFAFDGGTITGYGSATSVTSQKQDGYSSGDFSGVQIDADGTVNGVYTNGEKIPVAQLAVAKFESNDGLGRAGHNLWQATKASGEAAMGAAGTGGRGGIVAGALESSNVDIAAQFVDMISHQRAFQANSKTITTADEMLQEVVNLKR